ncbi:hypothetical protein CC2G_011790 [Coprinopsis cinerea AmutBmut pab1-1]|nr:hypothetical protein CC2G_011790 [Coprinopsis cinerea AmutBmut pab1-1]
MEALESITVTGHYGHYRSSLPWTKVDSKAQVALYRAFAYPSIRHITLEWLSEWPLIPFIRYGHLETLSIQDVTQNPAEKDPSLPLSFPTVSGATKREYLRLKNLHILLEEDSIDILQLLASAWAQGPRDLALSEQIQFTATYQQSVYLYANRRAWSRMPQAFLGSVGSYCITSPGPPEDLLGIYPAPPDLPDPLGIYQFPNITHLQVVLYLVNPFRLGPHPTWPERCPLYELSKSLRNGNLPKLRNFQLKFLVNLNLSEDQPVSEVAGLPYRQPEKLKDFGWAGMDAALTNRAAYPRLATFSMEFQMRTEVSETTDMAAWRSVIAGLAAELPRCRARFEDSFQILVTGNGWQ